MNSEIGLFYPRQSSEHKTKYHKLLEGATQLSPVFSESPKPYLNYRTAEKIFCRAFCASDKSRQDISVDAVKEKDGIGVKTFVTGSGACKFEKIAEFVNRTKYPLDESNYLRMIKQIADYRNTRLIDTIKKFDLHNTIYHYIVRGVGKIKICECPMTLINIDSITTPETVRGNAVKFKDGVSNYYFHLSKHTLFKQFAYAAPLAEIDIDYSIKEESLRYIVEELSSKGVAESVLLEDYDYVILPLYSTQNESVPLRSGLNQWNAGGRPRDPDEVYIPIPSVVHRKKPGFFPTRNCKFRLITEDGHAFTAKVCQDNSKALMTEPNKDLGKWLLRDMLGLKRGELATLGHLSNKKADNVIIYKISGNKYKISLHSFGEFRKEYAEA